MIHLCNSRLAASFHRKALSLFIIFSQFFLLARRGCNVSSFIIVTTHRPAIVMVDTRTTRRTIGSSSSSSDVTRTISTRNNVAQTRTKRSAGTRSSATTTSDSKRTKSSLATAVSPAVAPSSSSNAQPLLSLDPDCVFGVFQRRPSKRNKSPYVCDVHVESLNRTAIAHLPNLDMGGKCREGVRLLLKPARDRKGNPIGQDAVNSKYGTPKCEFIAQLVLVDDNDAVLSDDHAATNTPCYYSPTWVGAHPSLGESIVDQLLQRDQLLSDEVVDIRRQVTLNTTSSKVTRADFVVTHSDDTQRVVEVKTVVDTDYSSETSMDPSKLKGVFVSQSCPYRRTGLFPWGNSKQKGPSNEPVVSARAIKHVMELTDIVKKSETQSRGAEDSAPEKATIVFLVIRSDAEVFRPNVEACPSFCRYLKQAEDAGVEILVPRVRWEVDEAGQASCYLDKMLGIEWPELDY